MNLTSISPASAATVVRLNPVEQLDEKRKQAATTPDPQQSAKQLSSSEMLDKIKELSKDGLYSVRFEQNDEINSMVIRVVDKESGDVIRQIPAEELIQIAKTLKELRGLVVNTES